MDMGVRSAIGHYPPFETHSTWYADRLNCRQPLFGKRRALYTRRSETC